VLSYGLITLNVLTFILQSLPAKLGRQLVLWSPAVADGQLYRLVTSAFSHYGMMHLLLNMWALYVVGPALETALGRLRFGALYGLSALGGSVAVYLLAPLNTATAGASGAVFGLFGATVVAAKRLRLDVRWVVAVILINLIFTFTVPHISWQGHIGGLIIGTVIALAYLHPPAGVSQARRNAVQTAVTLVILVLFGVLICWRTAELASRLGRTAALESDSRCCSAVSSHYASRSPLSLRWSNSERIDLSAATKTSRPASTPSRCALLENDGGSTRTPRGGPRRAARTELDAGNAARAFTHWTACGR
jgi:membrane associated rhomboid family serine protease